MHAESCARLVRPEPRRVGASVPPAWKDPAKARLAAGTAQPRSPPAARRAPPGDGPAAGFRHLRCRHHGTGYRHGPPVAVAAGLPDQHHHRDHQRKKDGCRRSHDRRLPLRHCRPSVRPARFRVRETRSSRSESPDAARKNSLRHVLTKLRWANSAPNATEAIRKRNPEQASSTTNRPSAMSMERPSAQYGICNRSSPTPMKDAVQLCSGACRKAPNGTAKTR